MSAPTLTFLNGQLEVSQTGYCRWLVNNPNHPINVPRVFHVNDISTMQVFSNIADNRDPWEPALTEDSPEWRLRLYVGQGITWVNYDHDDKDFLVKTVVELDKLRKFYGGFDIDL